MNQKLLPCPFCGKRLLECWEQAKPTARCETPSCKGSQFPCVQLDNKYDIDAWNHRKGIQINLNPFKEFLLSLGVHFSKPLADHCKKGDDSFTLSVGEDFYGHFPALPKGFVYDFKSAIRLKMRNVDPHTDCQINGTPEGFRYAGSVFSALTMNCSFIHLQVGGKRIKLAPSQWVLFDDQTMHSVIAEKQWSGLAVQVFKKID